MAAASLLAKVGENGLAKHGAHVEAGFSQHGATHGAHVEAGLSQHGRSISWGLTALSCALLGGLYMLSQAGKPPPPPCCCIW
mgnify:CR=1 FL=1